MQISLDDIPEMLQNIEQVPEPNGRILGTFGKRQLGNEGEKDESSESGPIGWSVADHPEAGTGVLYRDESGEYLELPLLLKTLRLRPGSTDEMQKIIDKFIKDKKEQHGGIEKLSPGDQPQISETEDKLIHGWIDKFIKDKKSRHGM